MCPAPPLLPAPLPRSMSPDSSVSPPPTELPLSSLPPSAQNALHPSPLPLMETSANLENMQRACGARERGSSDPEESKVKDKQGKVWIEGADYVYEYVPVSQVRSLRDIWRGKSLSSVSGGMGERTCKLRSLLVIRHFLSSGLGVPSRPAPFGRIWYTV